MNQPATPDESFLAGVRVIEIANELGEYAGKVLAGLGAEVIKIEPPGGEETRRYGPFYQDRHDPESSLYFWHYNFGKRGVTLDLDTAEGQEKLRALAAGATVLLETRPKGYMAARGLDYEALKRVNPGLIVVRISPFGDDGPWSRHKGSDLVHLALGGIMMNCGYDPEPDGYYDQPPIAPQMWQAYQIAGEMAAMGAIGALFHRNRTGRGQFLSTSVHQCVAQQTESDLPNWIYNRLTHYRATCRHSLPVVGGSSISMTKDGRWLFPYRTYLFHSAVDDFKLTVEVLKRFNMADDLDDPRYDDPAVRRDPTTVLHFGDVIDRFIRRYAFDRDMWKVFQEAGLTWAPVRLPEENLTDEHWKTRQTFLEVEHPELGRSFTEIGAKWFCPDVPWRTGPRAPLLGEHNDVAFTQAPAEPPRLPARPAAPGLRPDAQSVLGKPVALAGIRYLDLSWVIASSASGRFLAGMGAEVIKVEHKTRIDRLRYRGAGKAPPGGRVQRDAATGPINVKDSDSPNRSGAFMEVNAGKRAISLNLKHPAGRELLGELVRRSDCLGEGYSPGTMDRLGLGYAKLKEWKPDIVYVQQSGMGQLGTYGRMRSYGPVAAAFAGTSEMSGMPAPYPPAGIGYSYLDWCGAYNMAIALLAGLYRRNMTGKGCWIDSSQVESGTYLIGTAILDYSANGRAWSRYGNRSPYKPAAPHGAYRTAGNDRWIAIACFDEPEWRALVAALGSPAWAGDERFLTLEGRLAHQGALDRLVNEETARYDGARLMAALQAAGVPAGICQSAEDRVDHDPQLRHLNWHVELDQTEIGRWPVRENPVAFSETPPYQGGLVDRHGPNYGEDNDYVYGELLGLTDAQIDKLAQEGAI
jgi:crotonobetainyl-CoA:carnitine CoA-transferase CaiB-like acyl-CoA transferase